MKAFDPNRKQSYTQEELIALHNLAETNTRLLLTTLDLPGAHAQINSMEQIRVRFSQDHHVAFPQDHLTTFRSG